MPKYCSIEDIKSVNNGSVDESKITDEIIELASTIVNDYTQQIFHKQYFKGTYKSTHNTFYTDHPILSLDEMSKEIDYIVGNRKIMTTGGGTLGTFTISGYWGYTNVPIPIRRSTAHVAIWLTLDDTSDLVMNADTAEMQTSSYETDRRLPAMARLLMRPYVRIDIGVC